MKITAYGVMIVVGLILLGAGLFGSECARRTSMGEKALSVKAMYQQTKPLLVFLTFTIVVGLFRARPLALAAKGLTETIKTSASLFPMLVILMVVMALGNVVMGYYKPEARAAITGKFKVVGVYVIATATATTSTISLQAKEMWKDSPAAKPQIIALLLIASYTSIGLFFFRMLGLDWNIARQLYCTGFFISFFVYPLVLLYNRIAPYQ